MYYYNRNYSPISIILSCLLIFNIFTMFSCSNSDTPETLEGEFEDTVYNLHIEEYDVRSNSFKMDIDKKHTLKKLMNNEPVNFEMLTNLLIEEQVSYFNLDVNKNLPNTTVEDMNDIISKIAPKGQQDVYTLKKEYEDNIKNILHINFQYNLLANNLLYAFKTSTINAYSSTILYLIMLRLNPICLKKYNSVIIFTENTILPGYIERRNNRLDLIGINTLEFNNDPSVYLGNLLDYTGKPIRVVDAELFTVMEIFKNNILNIKDLSKEILEKTALKYGFFLNDQYSLGTIEESDTIMYNLDHYIYSSNASKNPFAFTVQAKPQPVTPTSAVEAKKEDDDNVIIENILTGKIIKDAYDTLLNLDLKQFIDDIYSNEVTLLTHVINICSDANSNGTDDKKLPEVCSSALNTLIASHSTPLKIIQTVQHIKDIYNLKDSNFNKFDSQYELLADDVKPLSDTADTQIYEPNLNKDGKPVLFTNYDESLRLVITHTLQQRSIQDIQFDPETLKEVNSIRTNILDYDKVPQVLLFEKNNDNSFIGDDLLQYLRLLKIYKLLLEDQDKDLYLLPDGTTKRTPQTQQDTDINQERVKQGTLYIDELFKNDTDGMYREIMRIIFKHNIKHNTVDKNKRPDNAKTKLECKTNATNHETALEYNDCVFTTSERQEL